jgi:uncharacterized membrane protein YfcA
MFLLGVFALAVLSGGTAAVAGFGIGSLLTPLLASRFDTGTAVAAVAIPHAAATALRCWRLRRAVDWSILRRFGLLSAAGSLGGALLYTRLSNTALTLTLGVLLLATSAATLGDLPSKARVTGPVVGLLGLLSGVFGGLAGNQGGLRAAAMLSFSLPPVAYVATTTATAMMVDLVRTPIYLWCAGEECVWRTGGELYTIAGPIVVATAGVLAGTIAGERILLGLEPRQFRRVIAAIIGLLGIWLLAQAW